jgi:hypothetical protein
MQFAEGLSDRQAADAVRSRIGWKYVLSLELTALHHRRAGSTPPAQRLTAAIAPDWR